MLAQSEDHQGSKERKNDQTQPGVPASLYGSWYWEQKSELCLVVEYMEIVTVLT